ncbi:DUF6521 family protein [Marinobacter sp. M3C]|uniref:three component ABC system middle component n=1 Tax=Marinobacter sp. M3C TaxID=2917715 RepID=UPI002010BB5C|nr:three component ABC system middle component [Marinobacter sp. M3C]MCL1479669.1 DUF6521 family protein [Marinobacter sp.]UQG59639.1 DUF6521 family protein [Marinobacter sp. M3C]
MNINYYNNFGIGVVAIGAVLSRSNALSISKVFLVFPLLSHQKLLQYLARQTTSVKSIEKLISDQVSYFSNFNKRYMDSLVMTMNSIQYLNDAGYIDISDGVVKLVKPFEYDSKMGKRANSIFKASDNIAKLLAETESKLYLNLRVEL